MRLTCSNCRQSASLESARLFRLAGKYEGYPLLECKNCGQYLVVTLPVFRRYLLIGTGVGLGLVFAFKRLWWLGLSSGVILIGLGLLTGLRVVKSFTKDQVPPGIK